ncbi:MAG TPA: hypothetical protein VG347_12195 [Verrucomicrobiae bacterium]|nr:hypothetical protein [Verrucomicrobiae bacterium]
MGNIDPTRLCRGYGAQMQKKDSINRGKILNLKSAERPIKTQKLSQIKPNKD